MTSETNQNKVLNHKKLAKLLQMAYSAERAAAFAYQGHASSVKNKEEKLSIHQIEMDEWNHREEVLKIMQLYQIPVSKYYEIRFYIVGKFISLSCHFIGWFMPFFFAGRLESGNVCEYFKMMHYFHEIGIYDHNQALYEMGIKEKEHEVYFLDKIKKKRLLAFFEMLFGWGSEKSLNDVDLDKKFPIEDSAKYCKNK